VQWQPVEGKLGIGPLIRRAFGRHERRISEIYRGIFVDLDAFVASILSNVTAPSTVLEIGCGDGMVTERLARAFPQSSLTGIDICAQPGRLFRGDHSRVRFLRISPQELSAAETTRYQLVIIADVLHHVPHQDWQHFLTGAAQLLTHSGTLVLKDWVREPTPAYALGYLSDRLITADRIRYPKETELKSIAERTFGSGALRFEFRVRPWHCNLALGISPRPASQTASGASG
jgi:2-polyprenyl-3-methyl-5-hydroxy-6-metoxy-1,4-benzoquinol methylase